MDEGLLARPSLALAGVKQCSGLPRLDVPLDERSAELETDVRLQVQLQPLLQFSAFTSEVRRSSCPTKAGGGNSPACRLGETERLWIKDRESARHEEVSLAPTELDTQYRRRRSLSFWTSQSDELIRATSTCNCLE